MTRRLEFKHPYITVDSNILYAIHYTYKNMNLCRSIAHMILQKLSFPADWLPKYNFTMYVHDLLKRENKQIENNSEMSMYRVARLSSQSSCIWLICMVHVREVVVITAQSGDLQFGSTSLHLVVLSVVSCSLLSGSSSSITVHKSGSSSLSNVSGLSLSSGKLSTALSIGSD